MSVRRRASAALRRALEHVGQRIGAGEHGERPGTLVAEEAGDRPSANRAIHDSVHPRAEAPAAAHRQLPCPVGVEHVPAVKIRPRVIQSPIRDIERLRRRRLSGTRPVNRKRGIVRPGVERLGPGPAKLRFDSLAELPQDLQLHTVIGRKIVRIHHANLAELREREEGVGPETG